MPFTPGGTSAMRGVLPRLIAAVVVNRPRQSVRSARRRPGARPATPARRRRAAAVAAVDRDLHAVVGRLEVRVRADLDVREGGHRLVQRAGDRPFAGARVEGAPVDRRRPGTARARPRTCAGRSTARRAGPRRCARRPPARCARVAAGPPGRTPAARPPGCRPCADRARAGGRRSRPRSSASSSGWRAMRHPERLRRRPPASRRRASGRRRPR